MSWQTHRARAAALRRHHPDQPELADDARRALKSERAETYIRRLVAEDPALSIEVRAKLAGLLLPGDLP